MILLIRWSYLLQFQYDRIVSIGVIRSWWVDHSLGKTMKEIEKNTLTSTFSVGCRTSSIRRSGFNRRFRIKTRWKSSFDTNIINSIKTVDSNVTVRRFCFEKEKRKEKFLLRFVFRNSMETFDLSFPFNDFDHLYVATNSVGWTFFFFFFIELRLVFSRLPFITRHATVKWDRHRNFALDPIRRSKWLV